MNVRTFRLRRFRLLAPRRRRRLRIAHVHPPAGPGLNQHRVKVAQHDVGRAWAWTKPCRRAAALKLGQFGMNVVRRRLTPGNRGNINGKYHPLPIGSAASIKACAAEPALSSGEAGRGKYKRLRPTTEGRWRELRRHDRELVVLRSSDPLMLAYAAQVACA